MIHTVSLGLSQHLADTFDRTACNDGDYCRYIETLRNVSLAYYRIDSYMPKSMASSLAAAELHLNWTSLADAAVRTLQEIESLCPSTGYPHCGSIYSSADLASTPIVNLSQYVSFSGGAHTVKNNPEAHSLSEMWMRGREKSIVEPFCHVAIDYGII